MDRLPSGCLTALVAVQGGRNGDDDDDDDDNDGPCMTITMSIATAELKHFCTLLELKKFQHIFYGAAAPLFACRVIYPN